MVLPALIVGTTLDVEETAAAITTRVYAATSVIASSAARVTTSSISTATASYNSLTNGNANANVNSINTVHNTTFGSSSSVASAVTVSLIGPASSIQYASLSSSSSFSTSTLFNASASSTDSAMSGGSSTAGNGVSLSTPYLVAIGVGASILIVIVGVSISICVCCRRKRRAKRARAATKQSGTKDEQTHIKSSRNPTIPSTSYSGYDLDLTRDEAADVLHLPRPQPTFARHSGFNPHSNSSRTRSERSHLNEQQQQQQQGMMALHAGETDLGRGLRGGRESVWTDDSELDMFAVDGSTIARTLSTISRPNSEYDIERDAGTWMPSSATGTGTGMYSGIGERMATYGGIRSTAMTNTSIHSIPSPWSSNMNSNTGPSSSSAISPSAYISLPSDSGHKRQIGTYPSSSPSSVSGSRAPSRDQPPRLMVDTKINSGELVSSSLIPSSSSLYHPLSSTSPSASASASSSSGADTWAHPYPYSNTQQPYTQLSRGPSTFSHYNITHNMYPQRQTQRHQSIRQHMSARTDPFRSPESDEPGSGSLPTPTSSEFAYDSYLTSAAQANQRQTRSNDLDVNPSQSLNYSSTSGVALNTPPPALRRGLTIIRHADAGRVENDREAGDVEDEDEIHLPPAYGDIYGTLPR